MNSSALICTIILLVLGSCLPPCQNVEEEKKSVVLEGEEDAKHILLRSIREADGIEAEGIIMRAKDADKKKDKTVSKKKSDSVVKKKGASAEKKTSDDKPKKQISKKHGDTVKTHKVIAINTTTSEKNKSDAHGLESDIKDINASKNISGLANNEKTDQSLASQGKADSLAQSSGSYNGLAQPPAASAIGGLQSNAGSAYGTAGHVNQGDSLSSDVGDEKENSEKNGMIGVPNPGLKDHNASDASSESSTESSKSSAEGVLGSSESGKSSAESATGSAESGKSSAEGATGSTESGKSSAESDKGSAGSGASSADGSKSSVESAKSSNSSSKSESDSESGKSEGSGKSKGSKKHKPVNLAVNQSDKKGDSGTQKDSSDEELDSAPKVNMTANDDATNITATRLKLK